MKVNQIKPAEAYNPNSVAAQHRRSLDQSHATYLKAKADAPDATERDKQRYQNYLDKKEQMANDYNDRMERESIEQEALYRSQGSASAYDRDKRSSETGFGRRERDMSDESNLLYIYADGRLKQKMVSNQVEREARAQGFRDTPEQALKLHGIIRSKFKPGKWVQKQGTQWTEVHPFGKSDDTVDEESGMLKVSKDDDKQTILQNPTTGVQTQIDKTNPNSPRISQDETGKLKLQMPGQGGPGGADAKPNFVGKDVAVSASPVENISHIRKMAGL